MRLSTYSLVLWVQILIFLYGYLLLYLLIRSLQLPLLNHYHLYLVDFIPSSLINSSVPASSYALPKHVAFESLISKSILILLT